MKKNENKKRKKNRKFMKKRNIEKSMKRSNLKKMKIWKIKNLKIEIFRTGPGTDKGITIDDLKFHQCVRLGKFDKERAITFIPPDGTFELMTYRITENVNLPFKVIPVINEYGTNRIEARIKVINFQEKLKLFI